MARLQKGAIGVELILTVKENGAVVNLAAATGLKMYLDKPDNTIVEKTAVFKTDGTDGKLMYVTILDDLNKAGIWERQAEFTLGGFTGRTSKVSFTVDENIPPVTPP